MGITNEKISNDEKLPLYEYCNVCDQEHYATECEKVKNYLTTNSVIKSNWNISNHKLWFIKNNTVSQVLPLYGSYFMFFTIEYKDKPFFYFGKTVKSIKSGSNVTVKIYPLSNKKPSEMRNFYVYDIL